MEKLNVCNVYKMYDDGGQADKRPDCSPVHVRSMSFREHVCIRCCQGTTPLLFEARAKISQA